MAKGGITWTQDEITPRLSDLAPQMHSAIAATVEYFSDVAQGYMKKNAPWTDRTGNARSTLNATAFTEPDHYVIVVYHGMPYGIWLEVRWSGRYAIIQPTIDTVGPQLMRTLRKLMRRM